MGKLYIVPTPIGNLEGNITLRAVRVLKEADVVLAEDTRTTAVLLKHLGIEKRMFAHHKFNEHAAVESVCRPHRKRRDNRSRLRCGDTGHFRPRFPARAYLHRARRGGGDASRATAFVPALIQSGFPADRFCFEGFLPQKKGRNKRLEQLKEETRTIIFYESPYRVVKTLEQLAVLFGLGTARIGLPRIDQKFEETVREGWTKWPPISGEHEPKVGNSSSFLQAGRIHGPRKMKVSTTNDWKP